MKFEMNVRIYYKIIFWFWYCNICMMLYIFFIIIPKIFNIHYLFRSLLLAPFTRKLRSYLDHPSYSFQRPFSPFSFCIPPVLDAIHPYKATSQLYSSNAIAMMQPCLIWLRYQKPCIATYRPLKSLQWTNQFVILKFLQLLNTLNAVLVFYC